MHADGRQRFQECRLNVDVALQQLAVMAQRVKCLELMAAAARDLKVRLLQSDAKDVEARCASFGSVLANGENQRSCAHLLSPAEMDRRPSGKNLKVHGFSSSRSHSIDGLISSNCRLVHYNWQ